MQKITFYVAKETRQQLKIMKTKKLERFYIKLVKKQTAR